MSREMLWVGSTTAFFFVRRHFFDRQGNREKPTSVEASDGTYDDTVLLVWLL